MSTTTHFQCDMTCQTPTSSRSLSPSSLSSNRQPSPNNSTNSRDLSPGTKSDRRPIYRSKSTSTLLASTSTSSRRLSSGSACDTCRKRKTRCDGNQPCAFCVCNDKACTHTPNSRRKRAPSVTAPGILSNRLPTRQSRPSYLCLPWFPKTDADDKQSNNQEYSYKKRSAEQKLRLVTKAGYPFMTSNPWQCQDSLAPLSKVKPNLCLDHHSGPITQSWSLPTSSIDTYRDLQNCPPTKEEIPSIIDQLSCLTFSAATLASVDRNTNYPIYPLSSHVINKIPSHHVSPYMSIHI
ncbi:hypothetical protein F4703DRAFT_1863396 [Phycomyces blakesleeanus]